MMEMQIVFSSTESEPSAIFKQYSDSDFVAGFKASSSAKKHPNNGFCYACEICKSRMFFNIALLSLIFDLSRRLKSLTQLLRHAEKSSSNAGTPPNPFTSNTVMKSGALLPMTIGTPFDFLILARTFRNWFSKCLMLPDSVALRIMRAA
jgi:hypothetical protein